MEPVLGPILGIDVRNEILWPSVKLTDTGEESLRETADQVAVVANTRSGAVFTANIHGGVTPADARFSLEITGLKGWLNLAGGRPYGLQAGDLKLTSNPAARGWTASSLIARPDALSHLSVPGCFSTSLFLSLCVFT